jgi:hypothetical protein
MLEAGIVNPAKVVRTALQKLSQLSPARLRLRVW